MSLTVSVQLRILFMYPTYRILFNKTFWTIGTGSTEWDATIIHAVQWIGPFKMQLDSERYVFIRFVGPGSISNLSNKPSKISKNLLGKKI